MRKRDIMLISLPNANTVDVNAIRSDLVVYFKKKMSESRQRNTAFVFLLLSVCLSSNVRQSYDSTLSWHDNDICLG